jgi:ubiquinone/menaquinone biosynthesis C-methylase UbiE
MPTETASTPIEDHPEEYILGTGDQESDRLRLQHRLWSSSAHRLWEQAGIAPGQTVIDVGCGPGNATVDMAQIVGATGRVIAVDESPLFLKHLHDRVAGLRLQNVERLLGDVQEVDELIPDLREGVDMAYARWVMCFVSNPGEVVDAVGRLLKRGGRFIVQDYFDYERMTLAPRREIFSRVVRAVADSWRERGGDPDIISRLPRMLRERGFRVEHLDVSQRIARPLGGSSTMWAWPDTFWKSFLPRLTAMGQITAQEQQEFEAAWLEASADPDSFCMLPPVFELIAVKE